MHEPDEIDAMLTESALDGDAELRSLLVGMRAEGTSVMPLPGHHVARLLRRRPRRRRTGLVVAVIVGATVLAGGAAAASPGSPLPGAAATVIGGLLGSVGSDGGTGSTNGPHPSATPADRSSTARGGNTAPAPESSHAADPSVPAPNPESSHAAVVPGTRHPHPTAPPHPVPTPSAPGHRP